MAIFPISDSLTMIFGIIGAVLTILTIVIMIIYSTSPSAPEDIEVQRHGDAQRLNLIQVIIRLIRFIFNPENHGVVRRHLAAFTKICDIFKSSFAKVQSVFDRGLPIRSSTFDLLLRRSSSQAGSENGTVELDNVAAAGTEGGS